MAHRFALAYRRASDLASPPVLAHLDQALDACGRQDPTLAVLISGEWRASHLESKQDPELFSRGSGEQYSAAQ